MNNIYIFGMGKGKEYLDRCINSSNVNILGYINNYRNENKIAEDGKKIVTQEELEENCDYIIVTLMQFVSIRDSLLEQEIKREKIICFFDFKDAENKEYWSVIDPFKWRTELMWKHYNSVVVPSIDNLCYEIYSDSEEIKKQCPKIIDVRESVDKLISEKQCMARFGDNEFELMCGRLRTNYQNINNDLANRLTEVLHSDKENLMIAIADNYRALDKYTDDAAREIRKYLTEDVRKDHMRLLDLNRPYYDAYLSRPYIMYRDKSTAKERFDHIKQLWNDQDVLIVEGEYTRFGVGNDLLDNAASVSRIIVPSKNAFDEYEIIKEKTCQYGRDKLILAIIGPTATVLAYDLANENYWIVDIGQFDTEYEWFLRGVQERCEVRYKGVSEVISYDGVEHVMDDNIKKYMSEIICDLHR